MIIHAGDFESYKLSFLSEEIKHNVIDRLMENRSNFVSYILQQTDKASSEVQCLVVPWLEHGCKTRWRCLNNKCIMMEKPAAQVVMTLRKKHGLC